MTMMTNMTNEYRQLDLKLTMADSRDQVPDLVIGRMVGQELLGRPFEYVLSLFTQDSQSERLPTLLTQQEMGGLIGGTACVMLDYDPHNSSLGKRYFHGQIAAMRFKGPVPGTGICMYEAVIRPKVSMLMITQEYRIFRNISPVDIITKLLKNGGMINGIDFKVACTGDFGTRAQAIQYGESDANFIQRLMEDVGLSYFFQHSEDGHMMVLTDQDNIPLDVYDACPDYGDRSNGKVKYLWPGQIMRGYHGIDVYEYAYEMSTHLIVGHYLNHRNARKKENTTKQVWDDEFPYAKNIPQYRKRYYPFGHYVKGEGTGQWEWTGDSDKNYDLGRITQARVRADADTYHVEGNDRSLQCGYAFTMEGHPSLSESKTRKLITQARYELNAQAFPFLNELFGEDVPAYRVSLEVQPTQEGTTDNKSEDPLQPFVLPLEADRPTISGLQCAKVVALVKEEGEGGDDEELEAEEGDDEILDTDASHISVQAGPYVSVRLMMEWSDPDAAVGDNNPHQVTDYVRVAQFWAGNGRGALFVPRVGDEVLVAYIDGDPDNPMVVGSAYNSDNPPFIDPQEHDLITGIRTRVQTEEGIALPEDYKGSGFSELFFNDEESDENTGLVLRVSKKGTDAEYALTEKKENVNYVSGAAGFMIKSPEDTEKLIVAINAGDDTQTMYCGNIDWQLRNIKTIVGDIVSQSWNTYSISKFAFTVSTKAIVSVSQLTPNAMISSGLGGNVMRSFVGGNEIATGLRSRAAAAELALAMGEWTLLATGKMVHNDEDETKLMTAEVAMAVTLALPGLYGLTKKLVSAEVGARYFAAIDMAPGVLELECKNSSGDESEIKMTPNLYKFETEGSHKESEFTIIPGSITQLAKDHTHAASQSLSTGGIETRYMTNAAQSSFLMTSGNIQLAQTGEFYSSVCLSGSSGVISGVSPAVNPPAAGLTPAMLAAVTASTARQAAAEVESQAAGLKDIAMAAGFIPGVPAANEAVVEQGADDGDSVAALAEDSADDAVVVANAAVLAAAREADQANMNAPALARQSLLTTGVNINAGPAGGALVLNEALAAISMEATVLGAMAAIGSIVSPNVTISADGVELVPPVPPATMIENTEAIAERLGELEEVTGQLVLAAMDFDAMNQEEVGEVLEALGEIYKIDELD